MATKRAGSSRPRRSPVGAERLRDAARSRELIMRAATAEFSENGFIGARVADIAVRAGVNKQLISYYFGGKEGLYRALADRWRSGETALDDPDLPLDGLIANYARAATGQQELTRFMAWEGITYGYGHEDVDEAGRTARMREVVADLRRRQDQGELADDLDADCVQLALLAAGSAPVILPQMAASICGEPPTSEAFTARYVEQLARIARHLRGTAEGGGSGGDGSEEATSSSDGARPAVEPRRSDRSGDLHG